MCYCALVLMILMLYYKIAGYNVYSENQVYRVCHEFKQEGRLTYEYELRSGRPLELTFQEHVST